MYDLDGMNLSLYGCQSLSKLDEMSIFIPQQLEQDSNHSSSLTQRRTQHTKLSSKRRRITLRDDNGRQSKSHSIKPSQAAKQSKKKTGKAPPPSSLSLSLSPHIPISQAKPNPNAASTKKKKPKQFPWQEQCPKRISAAAIMYPTQLARAFD